MIKLGSNNIGQIYLGSNSIGKVYLGSNLVFQKGSSPTPTTIPYIRGGADGSYIDTGITPDSTMRVIVWARNFNPGVQINTMLFGSREEDVATNSIQFFAGITSNTGRVSARFGNATAYWTDNDFNMFGNYHKYELRPNGIYIDDSLKASVSVPSTMSNNFSLFLFASNNAGTRGGNIECPIDICACKIYKNDVLVRDFTAVNTPSVGLYDAVSGTVFTNAGTGTLTYGSFNPNAYTPLEYISSSGSSYIQTDIIATYSMPAVACFMPMGTVAQFYRFLGARDTSPSNMFEFATGNATYRNARLYLTFSTAASTAYTSNTDDYFKNKKIVAKKNNNVMEAYVNNVKVGDTITGTTDASFVVSSPLQIFSSMHTSSQEFVGRGYYVLLGDSSFVPAKIGSSVGMYDTYHDVFYESETSTPFTAGPTI